MKFSMIKKGTNCFNLIELFANIFNVECCIAIGIFRASNEISININLLLSLNGMQMWTRWSGAKSMGILNVY